VVSSTGLQTCTTSGALSCTVTGLTNGTAYSFRVRARNSVGYGAYSAPSNVVTPVAPVKVPGAPTRVAGTSGKNAVTVTWTAPASNGGAPILGYEVVAAPPAATCSTSGATRCTVTGLSGGTPYTFQVRARNSAGWGPLSTSSAPVTPKGPPR
jgi:hypothetical protein